MSRVAVFLVFSLVVSHGPARPPEGRGGGQSAAPQEGEPARIATHYFYWYRWPDEHMNPEGLPGREGHLHHFPQPSAVSYLDPAWHGTQFRDMAACGIEIALPVYWGAPGAYDRPGTRFSRAGIAPMVAALRELERRGERGVKLGLFYDTTSLCNDVRGATPEGGRPDLRSAAGRELFCDTVTEYFAEIPRDLWARLRGGALVVTYVSACAAGWDERLGDTLRARFAERFDGESVYLVADISWGEIGQDATTAWGAALEGPRIFPGDPGVLQLGPGYDDSPVPGRRTPRREREGGRFYARSWQRALAAKPELILIETWNEMHEGTEICESRECGRTYIDLTAEWVRRLRQGADPGPEIDLRYPEPRPRADRTWGREAAQLGEVSADYRGSEPVYAGLREWPGEDGPVEVAEGGLRPAAGWSGPVQYIYFQVSDFWRFDEGAGGDLEVRVDLRGDGEVGLEYDSRRTALHHRGAYAPAELIEDHRHSDPGTRGRDGRRRLLFRLREARLANRQNGGCDLRLVLRTRVLCIEAVRLGVTTEGNSPRPSGGE